MAAGKNAPRPVRRATPLQQATPLPQAAPNESPVQPAGNAMPEFTAGSASSGATGRRTSGRSTGRSAGSSNSRTAKGRGKKKNQPPVAVIIGGIGVVVLLGVIAIFALGKRGSTTTAGGSGDPNAWYNQPTPNVGAPNSAGARARKSMLTPEQMEERHKSFTSFANDNE
ncbi:MAG: hypothetical protein KDA42_02865 [Planctomycetales bacterium]|nr:hypothetical protein [Planctomycetales bacterium]